MTRFCATEYRRDGEYGVNFEASDWTAAQAVCAEHSWTLQGELAAIIPASETFREKEADEMIEALNDANDAVKH